MPAQMQTRKQQRHDASSGLETEHAFRLQHTERNTTMIFLQKDCKHGAKAFILDLFLVIGALISCEWCLSFGGPQYTESEEEEFQRCLGTSFTLLRSFFREREACLGFSVVYILRMKDVWFIFCRVMGTGYEGFNLLLPRPLILLIGREISFSWASFLHFVLTWAGGGTSSLAREHCSHVFV